jgi:hypothetical protein
MVCTNAASIAGNAMKVVLIDVASRLALHVSAVVIDGEAMRVTVGHKSGICTESVTVVR